MAANAAPVHGQLACRIVRRAQEKKMHVFSVGMSDDLARWSTWTMSNKEDAEGQVEAWTHTPVVLSSTASPDAPPALSPVISLPIITSDHFSNMPLEQVGFCSVGAHDGEVYHIFRTPKGEWNCYRVTVPRMTDKAKEVPLNWCFYTWEDKFQLLVLHGADWMNYNWKNDQILSERIHFTTDGAPTALSHVNCQGSFSPLFFRDTMYFYFRGTNGLIYECSRVGPDWRLFDVTKACLDDGHSATSVRPSASDVSVIALGNVVHIFFIGLDNRLRELYKSPGKPWRHVSLRRHVGGSVCSLPGQGRPMVSGDEDGCLHVFYKNDESRIGECFWKLRRSRWIVCDVSELIPKHGRVVSLLDIESDEGPHLFFASQDGKEHTLEYHHVHWTNNMWVSSFWGTHEHAGQIQAFDDPPGSPPPLVSAFSSILSTMGVSSFSPVASSSAAASSSNAASSSAVASSSAGGPPPPPPAAPPAPTPTQSVANILTIKKTTAPAKPATVIRLPMKEGSHTNKLHKYKPVRLVFISDTHNYPERVGVLPAGDILVHCGDFTVYGKGNEIEAFATWLDEQTQYKHKVVIAGNHETNPSKAKAIMQDHCTWLDNKMVTVLGLNFYGTTWGCDYSALPTKGVDILLTHKPPSGHGDVIYTGESRGSDSLAAAVHRLKPIIHGFGHNHEGFGATCDAHTVYINAATCMGGAKSSSRRGCIVVDVYPDLKSKYGSSTPLSTDDISSSENL